VDGLFSWLAPNLPEDLALMRPDGNVWLASIAHEMDAYVELADEEHRTLTARLPSLELRAEGAVG
jgi:hypothetical protein